MTRILNYIWRAWFILLAFVFIILFCIPVLLLSIREKDFKYAYVFIWLFCVIVFFGMGFRYSLIRKTSEKLDRKRNYIFIANHTSTIDIMLMTVLHRHHPVCFIGKAELAKIPIFGILYKRIAILVDRKSPKSRADVYRRAAEKMSHGQNIVIFPEGGVAEDPNILLDEFKDGAFILSTKHDFPIAVYTFAGLKEMFPFDNGKGHPGKVTVYLNKIMEPTTVNEMKPACFREIKSTLEQHYSRQ